jgi:hypothetical protein
VTLLRGSADGIDNHAPCGCVTALRLIDYWGLVVVENHAWRANPGYLIWSTERLAIS